MKDDYHVVFSGGLRYATNLMLVKPTRKDWRKRLEMALKTADKKQMDAIAIGQLSNGRQFVSYASMHSPLCNIYICY